MQLLLLLFAIALSGCAKRGNVYLFAPEAVESCLEHLPGESADTANVLEEIQMAFHAPRGGIERALLQGQRWILEPGISAVQEVLKLNRLSTQVLTHFYDDPRTPGLEEGACIYTNWSSARPYSESPVAPLDADAIPRFGRSRWHYRLAVAAFVLVDDKQLVPADEFSASGEPLGTVSLLLALRLQRRHDNYSDDDYFSFGAKRSQLDRLEERIRLAIVAAYAGLEPLLLGAS